MTKVEMESFDFNRSLFTLLEKENVSFYSGGPYFASHDYEIKKQAIRYKNKPLIFTFPGRRTCGNGMRQS